MTKMGMKRDANYPRKFMKRSGLHTKRSKRQKWIDTLRIPIKLAFRRIYAKLGPIPHVPGCVCLIPNPDFPEIPITSLIWDLDEINGRHTMGPIPGALWVRDMQLIRRCCHEVKTNAGHVDYRPEKIREAIWESSDLLVSLLPPIGGSNPYRKEDLSKAIREWARFVLEDARYCGTETTLRF
jgi:hypothetical protein